MLDRAHRLASALLDRLYVDEKYADGDEAGRRRHEQARSNLVSEVLAAELILGNPTNQADPATISKIVELLPQVLATEPMPGTSYLDLANQLRRDPALAAMIRDAQFR